MEINKIRLLILFVLLSTGVSAQQKFRHLTIEDGLSQSSVKCISQDSKGFLWFGTADGLNKYDGYDFTVFRNNPKNPSSISGNDISCIEENPIDSSLWIGTQDGGLNYFDRKLIRFTSFKLGSEVETSPFSNNVRDLLFVKKDKLLIASFQGGLFYFSLTDSSFTKPEFNNENQLRNVNCLELDNEGNIWIGSTTGLYRWSLDGEGIQHDPINIDLGFLQKNINIRSLKTDFKGNVWIGTENKGLVRFHPSSGEITRFIDSNNNALPSNTIRSILQSKKGEIWIGTMNGLCKYIPETSTFQVTKNEPDNPESVNNNTIYSLFEDHSGILWVGTYLGGINKLDPLISRFPVLRNFKPKENNRLNYNNIRSICTDNKNNLWIGTSNGLIRYNSENNLAGTKQADVELYFEGLETGRLLFDNELGLFISNGRGFMRKKEDNSFENLSPEILEQTGINIRSFSAAISDYNQNLWFATANAILQYDRKTKTFKHYAPKGPDGVEMQIYATSIIEDYSGKLWIGTLEGEIYQFDKHSEEFEQIIPGTDKNELVNFNRIFSLCEAKPNNLWIGTNRGLYHYNSEFNNLSRYLDSDGLSNNVVYAAINDEEGKIWCSTNKGISCYNPKTNRFQNYSYEHGLQSNEFNQGAYYKDFEGKIYMGGIKGLNIFQPEEIELNNFIPTVVITGMEIQYRKVTPETNPEILPNHINETKEIELNHKQNTFSFEFTALSFSLPKKNMYQYTLTSSDEEDFWIMNGNRRMATYTNISPGIYMFKVKGSNSDGVWNETPTSVKIIIHPPYWQRWWFRASILLLLTLSVYLVFYFRLKGIKQQKKLLEVTVLAKTNRLSKQKIQIEHQNRDLKEINKKIIEKNSKLMDQQHQILKQRDELIQLTEDVKEANQAKLQFFTSISHELRTPLTLIIAPLKELISRMNEMSNAEIQRRFGVIYANASKLLLMVNQLLDFRKTDVGKMKLAISKFNLTSFIQETAFLFNDLAIRGKYKFEIISDKEIVMVWADKEKLEKVIYNILSNAFKYAPEQGEIKIQLSTKTKNTEKQEALITISDNGEGIDKESIPFIFERFYQPDSSNKSNQSSGSGLGLAIAKKYIELHKGSISIISKKGEGSKFEIIIPIGKEYAEENIKLVDQKEIQKELLISSMGEHTPELFDEIFTSKDRKKPLILIVEDDEDLRQYLKDILKKQYRILIAKNVKEGKDLAKSKHPEIILCDVVLPDASGFDFCSFIKSEFSTMHIPLILLTSLTDSESRMKGLKAGADSYVTKPFDLQYLFVNIESLIEGRRRLRKKFNIGESNKIEEVINGSNEQLFLDKAVACVESNLDKSDFNVEKFCKYMELSQPQVYRKIKALTKQNISEFIKDIRLRKAASLLKTGNYKINEVAYETGFNDPNYFAKSFTKLFGLTPSEFIKSLN